MISLTLNYAEHTVSLLRTSKGVCGLMLNVLIRSMVRVDLPSGFSLKTTEGTWRSSAGVKVIRTDWGEVVLTGLLLPAVLVIGAGQDVTQVFPVPTTINVLFQHVVPVWIKLGQNSPLPANANNGHLDWPWTHCCMLTGGSCDCFHFGCRLGSLCPFSLIK